ncbi:DNA polymerase domain-containing protein [Aeromicrobium alkaliterrae]|uniref:Non-homologous end-joining DNA ligase n=1 Tax=Aeromicrobium alkaliterrae TaxID=302168 RepID=A0ABP4VLZ7_9ACTN
MAAKATEIDAGGISVRVSSPDRVVFEATETTPEFTKLQVVEYVVAVEDGIMRALRERPTALERWPKGVREGMRLTTGQAQGDAFYSKRVPKGVPSHVPTVQVHFPSGRTAEEICPAQVADLAWAAHMGTITFHPWAMRRADVDRPDELRIDLDPQDGTDFRDAVDAALATRELLAELGIRAFVKTSGNRGVHVFVRLEPRWTVTSVRHAAIAVGRALEKRHDGVTTAWWKEERGSKIFVDFNQNARDRTIASAYSLRPKPGAPVSFPVLWDDLAGVGSPRDFNLGTVPELLAAQGDAWAEIDDVAHDLTPLLDLWAEDPTEMPYPPDYPKMPGEPKRVQPSKAKKD